MKKAKTDLKTYKAKRDFSKTPEPKTSKKSVALRHPVFVVQEHYASHKHFDFRLEIDGVLASWAVPKGISSDPQEKHLAIPTEDHPMDYATFEGIIPEGNYGAGTVMVWDIGHYENIKTQNGKLVPIPDCYKKGRIEIELFGKKLQGKYALIKTKSYGKDYWLIFKMLDSYAGKPIKNKTKSALSGRTMKEIASDS